MTIIHLLIITTGIGYLVLDYYRCRSKSVEDRYMALYGCRNWDSCNMELCLSFDSQRDREVKALFQKRLADHLHQADPHGSLFHEKPRVHRKGIDFYYDACTTLQELRLPRKGIYLNGDQPGRLNIVWNHIQSDGIRLWQNIRPLFTPIHQSWTTIDPRCRRPLYPNCWHCPQRSDGYSSVETWSHPKPTVFIAGLKSGRPSR